MGWWCWVGWCMVMVVLVGWGDGGGVGWGGAW